MKKRIEAAFPIILLFFVLLLTFVFHMKWKYAWTSVFVIPIFYALVSNMSFKRKLQAVLWPSALMAYFDVSLATGQWAIALIIIALAIVISSLLETRIDVSTLFSLGIIVLYIYLGFAHHLWHPGWIIFFLIPIFNILFPNKIFVKKKKEKEKKYVHIYFHSETSSVDLTVPSDQVERILKDIYNNYPDKMEQCNVKLDEILRNLRKKNNYKYSFEGNEFVFSVNVEE